MQIALATDCSLPYSAYVSVFNRFWNCTYRWRGKARRELLTWAVFMSFASVLIYLPLATEFHWPLYIGGLLLGASLLLCSRAAVWCGFIAGAIIHVYSGVFLFFTPFGFYLMEACLLAAFVRFFFWLFTPCWHNEGDVPNIYRDRARDEWVRKGRKDKEPSLSRYIP